MKTQYIFFSIIIVFFCVYPVKMATQEKKKNVTLRVIRVMWPNKLWHTVTLDTTLVTVEEGMRFGADNTLPYFTLLEIKDNSNIKVDFSRELFIIGESLHSPSDINITHINLQGKCFRMIKEDYGFDFCIHIVPE